MTMLWLCLGAFGLGLASSLVLPCMPFFLALVLAVGTGAGSAMWNGAALGRTLSVAVFLLVVTQVSYGLGLVGQAGFLRLSELYCDASERWAVWLQARDDRARPGKLANRRRGQVP